jgi:hypothetical protein
MVREPALMRRRYQRAAVSERQPDEAAPLGEEHRVATLRRIPLLHD